jgi:DNA-directed RNA polymerase specialized sigma24 family protein
MKQPSPEFPTTSWTLVHVLQGADEAKSREALNEICKCYWYPIYAFLRRQGHPKSEAEDLVQQLFESLLAEGGLQEVRRDKGKLRSFLIGAAKRQASRQRRRAQAEKRGGGEAPLSLDDVLAERRYALEPADPCDPEQLFERAWAVNLLETIRDRMRQSFERNGRLADYEALEAHLGWDDEPAPYAALALKLQSNESAVRVLVHRLRAKFREMLRQEVAKTVVSPAEVEAELAWLRRTLGSGR